MQQGKIILQLSGICFGILCASIAMANPIVPLGNIPKIDPARTELRLQESIQQKRPQITLQRIVPVKKSKTAPLSRAAQKNYFSLAPHNCYWIDNLF